MNNILKEKVEKSIFIIREALREYKNPAVMWSTGKDSTVMLDLIRKAIPMSKIPIPVVHIDTGKKFPEIYEYRDKIAKEWNLPLMVIQNTEHFKYSPDGSGHFECCMALKTNVLKQAIKINKWDALIMSIRRDEDTMREIEHYFSPRDKEFNWHFMREKTQEEKDNTTNDDRAADFVTQQETEFAGWNLYQTDFGKDCSHVRVHPILHWDEVDIWEYIREENLPMNPLYFAKDGKRYRSLGCIPCTTPIDSSASNIDDIITELKNTDEKERAGRSQSKEQIMRRLRVMGYM